MDLLCIEPGFKTRQVWPSVRDMIKLSIETTNLSDFDAVERDVLQGRSLLWLAWDGLHIMAAATTELVLAQERKTCVVVACAGRGMETWLPLLSRIEDYAQAEGCVSMRIIGRRGWSRVLDGYRERFAIMEKTLPKHQGPTMHGPQIGPVPDGKLQPIHADAE